MRKNKDFCGALWSNTIDFGHRKYYLLGGETKYTVAAFAAAVTTAMPCSEHFSGLGLGNRLK